MKKSRYEYAIVRMTSFSATESNANTQTGPKERAEGSVGVIEEVTH
jgi:hypothetical protein